MREDAAPYRSWFVSIPWARAAWSEILRLVKYGLVGASNTVVSMLVLNLFFFALPPTTSSILVLGTTVGYLAGDLNSYWWNKSWTFAAGKASWPQFARFMTVSVVCMSLNALIVWGSSGWLLTLALPSWLLGNMYQVSMILSGSLGYLACRQWVFRRSAARPGSAVRIAAGELRIRGERIRSD